MAKKTKTPVPANFDAALLARMRQVSREFTYQELGRISGTHPENARRYITGQSAPSVRFLAGLARSLGLSLDWLILGEETQQDAEQLLDNVPPAVILERLAKRLGAKPRRGRR